MTIRKHSHTEINCRDRSRDKAIKKTDRRDQAEFVRNHGEESWRPPEITGKTKSQRSSKQNHGDNREPNIAEINRTSKSSPRLITKSAEAKITKIPSREHGGENKPVNTRSLRQRKSRRLGVQSSRSEKTAYKKNQNRRGHLERFSQGCLREFSLSSHQDQAENAEINRAREEFTWEFDPLKNKP